MAPARKILVIQARNLGDSVIGTAMVETLACASPDNSIDVLTRPEIAQVFLTNPHVNEVLTRRFPMIA